VAIYRLLREASFGPDETASMSEAYETALKRLGLIDRTDPVTELVAAKIIEIARGGERSAIRICDQALKELGVPK
jgi:hypothetical protein